ncbi:ATP-grasp fold amidoligase family protein [Desulfolucanica intricata]|uniref:ATP-grasp fold amidoligase family protein n=1 Tax=Desulfolucanica intricata TaxID=1285191 RepID=UPI000B271477|nr:ATP-grasp fold amidoligase family protein [Desulfolucanica intricata]
MSKFNTLVKTLIHNPSDVPKLFVVYLSKLGLLNWLPDVAYLKLHYRVMLKRKLDLNNPKTFNEKLQWLKLFDRNPEYTNLVDKYAVRDYVKNLIGEEYLIPLIGIYNNFDEINFNKLPNQFVLKCTHDSGGVILCNDKSKLDIDNAKMKINDCLKRNFFYYSREWPYKNVKPRIICEKYLVDESGIGLIDYKFMCFNGKAKCIFVCLNRFSPGGLNIDIYDTKWNKMPFGRRHHPNSGSVIPKPRNFDKMVEFAEKLSKDIPFIRVDFYESNGRLYFGELTFFPGAGLEEFTPDSYDLLLGSWLVLPKRLIMRDRGILK